MWLFGGHKRKSVQGLLWACSNKFVLQSSGARVTCGVFISLKWDTIQRLREVEVGYGMRQEALRRFLSTADMPVVFIIVAGVRCHEDVHDLLRTAQHECSWLKCTMH